MASPIGHALAGCAIGRAAQGAVDGRFVAGGALLAIAPDFDFLPGVLVGQPALHHQGVSHSFAVALAVSLLAALLLYRNRRQFLRAWALFFAAYASHLAIDLFGPDGRPPIGIPLFWPWSDSTYIYPETLLPGFSHVESTEGSTREWLTGIFSWGNLRTILIEMALAAPLLVLGELCHRLRGPGGPSTPSSRDASD